MAFIPGSTLNGFVIDKASGQAIVGATVFLDAGAQYQQVTVYTDVDGYYIAQGLLYGQYGLSVSASGYNSISKTWYANRGVAYYNLDFQLEEIIAPSPEPSPTPTPTLVSRLPIIVAVAIVAVIGLAFVFKKKR